MRVVVQKCQNAKVSVSGEVVGQVDFGLLLLVGFTKGDTPATVEAMVKKIVNLRIFEDQYEVMNLSVQQVGGSVLSISQFTLYADTTKGNRPSYQEALTKEEAEPLYDYLNGQLTKEVPVATGVFGEFMEVTFTNIGPTTILLER